MSFIIENPVFGLVLTLLALEAGILIQKKTQKSYLNPLMLAIVFIIGFLKLSGVSYEDYNRGGVLISFFLAPTTVVLAVPLYRKFHLLKAHAVPILAGVFAGTIVNTIIIISMSRLLGLEELIEHSLIPKSITTPIGISLSDQLGGMPQITVAAIIVTGITGAILGPVVFKFIKVEDKVARGIAMGTSSHALGTVKAMEMGETEGAMSSLAISVTGVMTVLLVPILVLIFG